MALTNMTVVEKTSDEFSHMDVVTCLGPASYATGGELFDAAFQDAVGHDKKALFVSGYGGDYHVEYIPSTGKLKIRNPADGAEVTAAVNLSGVTFRLAVWSK